MTAPELITAEKSKFSEMVKHFSPAWFACVMGTGGLVNLLYLLSSSLPFLKPMALILFWLNIVLFIVIIVPWLLRWSIGSDKSLNCHAG